MINASVEHEVINLFVANWSDSNVTKHPELYSNMYYESNNLHHTVALEKTIVKNPIGTTHIVLLSLVAWLHPSSVHV